MEGGRKCIAVLETLRRRDGSGDAPYLWRKQCIYGAPAMHDRLSYGATRNLQAGDRELRDVRDTNAKCDLPFWRL